MDSWPSDNRLDDNEKEIGKQTSVHYPTLQFGQLGALTLSEHDSKLKWKCLVDRTAEIQENRLVAQNSTQAFPPTRYVPPPTRKTTIRQRSEQGANFIRTHFPDIDVEAELLRQHIAEDEKINDDLAAFDPLQGNLMDFVVRHDGYNKRSVWLAFPMGELNKDLNLSPFSNSGGRNICNETVFTPTVEPFASFDTPILQIVVSSLGHESKKQDTFFAVRTFNSVVFYKFDSLVQLPQEISTISHSEVEDRPIMDMKLMSMSFTALLVNDHGDVYMHAMRYKTKSTTSTLIFEPSVREGSAWRLGLCIEREYLSLLSSREIEIVDINTGASTILYTVPNPEEILVSIEDEMPDGMIRVVSTRHVIWLDKKLPGKVLLVIAHNRHFERSLCLKTITVKDRIFTLLSSRHNGLVSVYEVSRDINGSIRVGRHPYVLNNPVTLKQGHLTGQAVFHFPLDTKWGETVLFRLSEDGHIDSIALGLASDSATSTQQINWPQDVKELGKLKFQPYEGAFNARERTEVDLSAVYDKIFRQYLLQKEQEQESQATDLFDLVENAMLYWKNAEEPTQHILTYYDILFRSGSEPKHPSRADFLTGSIVNSHRGFRAISQARFSADNIRNSAAWSHNIGQILSTLDPEILTDINENANNFHQFDLSMEQDNVDREDAVREDLALDLKLASDIFSSEPLIKPAKNVDNALETLTEALTISAEPPPVSFHFLNPRDRELGDANMEMKDPFSLSIRSLLSEWDVGSDPDEFIWRDPYTSGENISKDGRLDSPAPYERLFFGSQATQPPKVLPSNMLPPKNKTIISVPIIGLSQPTTLLNTSSQPTDVTTQPQYTSTQVLPGPFGGQPVVNKKKSAKRRLGGF